MTKLRTEVEIEVTPRMLAEAFAEMDDDRQAKFFVELAEIEKTWDRSSPCLYIDQWYEVGLHLVDCECSTEGGREVIRRIAAGMEHAERKTFAELGA